MNSKRNPFEDHSPQAVFKTAKASLSAFPTHCYHLEASLQKQNPNNNSKSKCQTLPVNNNNVVGKRSYLHTREQASLTETDFEFITNPDVLTEQHYPICSLFAKSVCSYIPDVALVSSKSRDLFEATTPKICCLQGCNNMPTVSSNLESWMRSPSGNSSSGYSSGYISSPCHDIFNTPGRDAMTPVKSLGCDVHHSEAVATPDGMEINTSVLKCPEIRRIEFLSPDHSASDADISDIDGSPGLLKKLGRGRPRSDSIQRLVRVGSASKCPYLCTFCSRAFPRDKSLQAHMRTHTGERPFACDYPGCTRAFCQSGQLKTHQRLHTGERPFTCSVTGCGSRFIHANRHCTQHPSAQLQRVSNCYISTINNENDQDVISWLQRHIRPLQPKLPVRRALAVGAIAKHDDTSHNRSLQDIGHLAENSSMNIMTEESRRVEGALALIELALAAKVT